MSSNKPKQNTRGWRRRNLSFAPSDSVPRDATELSKRVEQIDHTYDAGVLKSNREQRRLTREPSAAPRCVIRCSDHHIQRRNLLTVAAAAAAAAARQTILVQAVHGGEGGRRGGEGYRW